MKKLLLLLVPALLLISCNNDDDSSSASVEGTWKLTTFTTSQPSDVNNDGVETTNFIAETNCYNNSFLILSSNSVANARIEELDLTLDLVAGTTDQYEYTVDCLSAEDAFGVWAQNNNTVTVTIDGEPLDLSLSGNTLSVTIPDFAAIEVEQNGTIVTEFVGATLVFTKQ